MARLKQVKLDFFSELFNENRIPEIYSGLSYGTNYAPSLNEKASVAALYSMRFIPNYLHLHLLEPDKFKVIKIKQFYPGCAISLESVTDPEQYLKAQFGSNAKTIRRYVTRLESCFTIKYHMFYGEIDHETYSFIMNSLKKMVEKRFTQLNDVHQELPYWNEIYEKTYAQIQKKQASLFVIYDGEKPIEISLNYHFDKILFSSTSSFDIDYSKFGLGHVEIYKQIEWCLANDIQIFEMGEGDLDYKRRWSNCTYNFEHHIAYHNHATFPKLHAYLELVRVKLRTYLNSKNIQIQGYKLVTYKPKRKKIDSSKPETINYECIPNTGLEIQEKMKKIGFNQEPYAFLRKLVYDYLYSNVENIDDIEVYEIEKDCIYVIKGKKASHKITITA